MERGKGELRITMSDPDAFELGVNLATTPGKVVFQNELIQLIQFEPVTEQVHRTPIVMIPAWINKYYILDLNQKKSFIRWALGQGYTVFAVSWVNPDETLAQKTFEDYLVEGVIAALDAIEAATGEHEVSAVGYCIGGTMLAVALGYLAGIGRSAHQGGNHAHRPGRFLRTRRSLRLHRREAARQPRPDDG
jgi:polyhydroxyalkanoate synthase